MSEEEKENVEDDIEEDIMKDLDDLEKDIDDTIGDDVEIDSEDEATDSDEMDAEAEESDLKDETEEVVSEEDSAESDEMGIKDDTTDSEIEEKTEEAETEEVVSEDEAAESDEDNAESEEVVSEDEAAESDEDNVESEEVDEEIVSDPSLEEKHSEEVDTATKKKNIVEAALFVAGRPISMDELNVKTEIRKRELEGILNELMMDYLDRATSLEIIQIQEKFSMQIKPEYTPNVKKFASGGLIPDAVLKTLTIIALKQPLLKSMLIKLRGSGAYEHVKFLLDRGFISGLKKGRSVELLTTEQFADTFGLSRDLATLKKQMIAQLGIQP
jgi:segregation and condensation protein B